MDEQHPKVEITGYSRNEVLGGKVTYELELSFSNGKKHRATVSDEAFKTYLEVTGKHQHR